MDTMRDYMLRRFGAGQPEVLQERVRLYLLGMPDPHGVPFPSRVNIEIKLHELEEERECLWQKRKRQRQRKAEGWRPKSEAPPLLCHNWSKGNGYCRYAAVCNFSHDRPQGGGKRKWKENSTSLPAKAVKRAKKEIMSMVVEALTE